jgi:simple sugar transport system substrate-binding protein
MMFAHHPMPPDMEEDRSQGKDVTFGTVGRRFCSITHDILGDPFWAVYRKGLADAANRFGCQVHHRAPEHFSPPAMVGFIEAAIAERPEGILCTVPDAEAVDAPLRQALSEGIPVICINAADPRPADRRIPYLLYIGADDATGGHAVAERLLAGGTPARALCVDHYLVDNACHNARCSGFTTTMRSAGATAEKLRVSGDDPDRAVAQIAEHIDGNPDIGCVCTLGPPGCEATIEALQLTGKLDQVRHASFDLAPAQLDAVAAGRLDFTIDSQQYLQGYLGIGALWLYAAHSFLPAGDILTGPMIVDQANIEAVRSGVGAGIR